MEPKIFYSYDEAEQVAKELRKVYRATSTRYYKVRALASAVPANTKPFFLIKVDFDLHGIKSAYLKTDGTVL